jgi:CubicO group peptidase (beta-lactamase class C family)
MPYAQFLQDNLFTPLGMKDTGYDSAAAIIPMRASGYSLHKDRLENADFIDMTVPYSAGSLYSTTHDLLLWQRALYGGKVLQPASLKKMTTPFKDNYAMGLSVRDDQAHLHISHNGGINGFATALSWYPNDRLAVVMLDNVENGDPNVLSQQLADIVFGRKVILASERKEIALDPAILDRYVGRYQVASDFVLAVTREGDHLVGRAGGLEITLFAEKPKAFFSRTGDWLVSFVAKGNIPATALILSGRGRVTTAKRLP